MNEAAFALAGLAMGVAAAPHCAAMCAAPCAALCSSGRRDTIALQLGRLAGYSVAGAVVAGSAAALGALGLAAPALRPLWLLVHLGFLALGAWWLLTGRMPAFAIRRSGSPLPAVVTVLPRAGAATQKRWRAPAAGLAWVAWPCAALQAALLVAALANGAAGGAAFMAAYAIGSMPALAAMPWAWARWRRSLRAGGAADSGSAGLRLAGLGAVAGSGWAIGHGLWERVAGLCGA